MQIFGGKRSDDGRGRRGDRQPHPVRGPSADAGTVYELGFMAGRGNLCLGYSNDPTPYPHRVAARARSRTRRRLIDAHGLTVEDFRLVDNLMMMHALDLHGFALVTPREKPADLWRDLTAFEACVELAAQRLRKPPGRHDRNGQIRHQILAPQARRVALVERGCSKAVRGRRRRSRRAGDRRRQEGQQASEPIAADA